MKILLISLLLCISCTVKDPCIERYKNNKIQNVTIELRTSDTIVKNFIINYEVIIKNNSLEKVAVLKYFNLGNYPWFDCSIHGSELLEIHYNDSVRKYISSSMIEWAPIDDPYTILSPGQSHRKNIQLNIRDLEDSANNKKWNKDYGFYSIRWYYFDCSCMDEDYIRDTIRSNIVKVKYLKEFNKLD